MGENAPVCMKKQLKSAIANTGVKSLVLEYPMALSVFIYLDFRSQIVMCDVIRDVQFKG